MPNRLVPATRTSDATAPPASRLVAGELATNAASGRLYVNASAGVLCVGLPVVVARLTADAAAIGTALATVPGLTVAVGPGEVWSVEWQLLVALSVATATFGVNVVGPAGAAGDYSALSSNGAPANGSAAARLADNALNAGTGTGQFGNPGGTTTAVRVAVQALVVNGATAGAAGLQCLASTGTVTPKILSSVRAERWA